MDRIDTVRVPKNLPCPAAAADVSKVLAVICTRRPRKDLPLDRLRDRVLFETAYVCGARASEVCGLHVEDLDLRLDDEHVRIHGKGGSVRTVPIMTVWGCATLASAVSRPVLLEHGPDALARTARGRQSATLPNRWMAGASGSLP